NGAPQKVIAEDDCNAEQDQHDSRIESERYRTQCFRGEMNGLQNSRDQVVRRESGENDEDAADHGIGQMLARNSDRLFQAAARVLMHSNPQPRCGEAPAAYTVKSLPRSIATRGAERKSR